MKKNTIAVLIFSLISLMVFSGVLYLQLTDQSAPSQYTIDLDPPRIRKVKIGLRANLASLLFDKKPILLTIDDGPSNQNIDLALLAILKKHTARSIWFISCKNLGPALNPSTQTNRETLLEIQRSGHLIANHGYNHLNLKKLDQSSPEKVHYEVEACNSLIQSITGSKPEYFRAPFGSYSSNTTQIIHNQGMKILNWSVPLQDTFSSRNPVIIDGMHKYIENIKFESGDVILMHDITFTLTILDKLLSRLDDEGFVFVVPD